MYCIKIIESKERVLHSEESETLGTVEDSTLLSAPPGIIEPFCPMHCL